MAEKAVDLGNRRSPRYRRWQGRLLHPSEEAFMFFRDEGPVPETLRRLHRALSEIGLAHVFIGATALKAYGLRRTTEDVDVCLRAEDLKRFRSELVESTYLPVQGRSRRFYDPKTQVTIDVLVSGDVAGRRERQQAIKFPDPSEGRLVEGIPVPPLARLIALKLVTWRLQDWADVVALIRANRLDEHYGDQFNPQVRQVYLQCYDEMIEEDRYNPEIHDQPPTDGAGGRAGEEAAPEGPA